MKRIIIIVASILSSLMLFAQNKIVLYGSYKFQKYLKKSKLIEGSFVLLPESEKGVLSLYKGGAYVDVLSENYEYPGQKKATLEVKDGKIYLDSIEVTMPKELMKNVLNGKSHVSHYSQVDSSRSSIPSVPSIPSNPSNPSHLSHVSHSSHASHASHYSSIF